MLRWTLIVKILLEAAITVGFRANHPMAFMFFGYVLADVGALWVAL